MVYLSIIIPAYNEEKRIKLTVDRYIDYIKKEVKNFELLIIVNGSTDKTYEISKKLARKYKQVKAYNFPEKIGKGGAIIEGFKIAKGKLIGFVDADLSFTPETFHKLIKTLNKRDVDGIIASRWLKGSRSKLNQPIKRRVAGKTFNLMVRFLFGIKIRDTQCGCKIFKRKAVKTITKYLGITKWAFDIDILYQLKRNNFVVKEIPVEWQDTYGSKIKIFSDSIEMLSSISRLRLVYSPFKFLITFYDKLPKYIKLNYYVK